MKTLRDGRWCASRFSNSKTNPQGLSAFFLSPVSSQHETCAQHVMSFGLPADLLRSVLHHLPPRPAPSASLTQYPNCQPLLPPFLPSPSPSLRCVASRTKHAPPLSSCPPRLNLLFCFRRHSIITTRRLVGGTGAPCCAAFWQCVGVRLGIVPRRYSLIEKLLVIPSLLLLRAPTYIPAR